MGVGVFHINDTNDQTCQNNRGDFISGDIVSLWESVASLIRQLLQVKQNIKTLLRHYQIFCVVVIF